MSEIISEARRFVKEKHGNQRRKDGSRYYLHPYTVQERLKAKEYNEDYQLAGLFHDLLEDTDATEDEILKLSNEKVLEAVKLLTKKPGYSKEEYIENILKNPIAKAVKNEDRIHNLLDSVNAGQDFIVKYLENTREYYLNKFSDELDAIYEITLNKSAFSYCYDSSLGIETSPIYRTNSESTWRYNKINRLWKQVPQYEWVEMGDDATPVEYEYLKSILKDLP